MKFQGLTKRSDLSFKIGIVVSILGYLGIASGLFFTLTQDHRILFVAGGASLVLFGGELMFRKS